MDNMHVNYNLGFWDYLVFESLQLIRSKMFWAILALIWIWTVLCGWALHFLWFSLLVAVGYSVALTLATALLYATIFSSKPDAVGRHQLNLSPAGLLEMSSQGSETLTKWASIARVSRDRLFVTIHLKSKFAFQVPTKAFGSRADLDQFFLKLCNGVDEAKFGAPAAALSPTAAPQVELPQ